MKALFLLTFSLFSFVSAACPEERARARMQEEAEGLNGKIEEFYNFRDGSYQGVIAVRFQQWNGKVNHAKFVVEVDPKCRVDVWKLFSP